MNWARSIAAIGSAVLLGGLSIRAAEAETVQAELSGFGEVPPASSLGSGEVRATISESSVEFELSYSNLSSVQEAHIAFGQARVNGGISVVLCSNRKHASERIQRCPKAPATVRGVIGPDDVIGPVQQGVEPGAFAKFVEALRANVTYVNVKTDRFPGGEIRGQLARDVAALVVEEIIGRGVQPNLIPGREGGF